MDGARRVIELGEQAAGRVIDASGDLTAGLVDIGRQIDTGPVDLVDIILDDAFEAIGHPGAAGFDQLDQLGAGRADSGGGGTGRSVEALHHHIAVLLDADMDGAGSFIELGEQAAGRVIDASGDLVAGLVDIARQIGAGPVDLVDIVLDDALKPIGHAGAAGFDELEQLGAG